MTETASQPLIARREDPSFFLTYLRRELRGRARQVVLVASGLAVGVGLVLAVSAATAGVEDAQTAVLHALYGARTEITVTSGPASRATGTKGIFSPGKTAQLHDVLHVSSGLGLISGRSVSVVLRLPHVAAAAGGLTLRDTDLRIPAAAQVDKGGGLGSVTTFSVDGVDLRHPGLGPLSSGKIVTGRVFTAADTSEDVVIVDSRYAAAHTLSVGSSVVIAATRFRLIAIIRQARQAGAADSYIPLARAQALATAGDGSARDTPLAAPSESRRTPHNASITGPPPALEAAKAPIAASGLAYGSAFATTGALPGRKTAATLKWPSFQPAELA